MNQGAQFILRKLTGWFQKPPVNLTQREAGGRLLGQPVTHQREMLNPYGLATDPLKRFEQLSSMAESELGRPVIELFAEEATQPDTTKGRTVWYECNDGEVEKEINEMLERIHMEDYIFGIAQGLAATGNNYQRILWTPDEGIQQLVGTKVNAVTRLWHPTTRKLLGFRWADERPNEPVYSNAVDVFAPWDFIHFRRIYSSDTEYGRGLIDHLYTIWKKLEMATDQMLVYRLHTMPTRYALQLDVGNMDFTDAMQQAQMWKLYMRQQIGLDQQNPGAAGLQSRFDPAAVDSFIIIPKRSNEDNTEITTLTGDKDVPDIEDVEYLTNIFLGGTRIPKAYLGHEEDSGGLAKASLISQDIRFARMVRVLRRPIVAGIHRLACLHLAFKGKDASAYKIKVKMSAISSIEEEIRMATMEKQASLAGMIADICGNLGVPNREVADLIFREYLSVPRWFADVAKLSLSVQRALNGGLGGEDGDGGMGGGGGMGMGMGMSGGGGGGFDDDLDIPEPDAGPGVDSGSSDDSGMIAASYNRPKSPKLITEYSNKPIYVRSTKRNQHQLMEALRIIQNREKTLTEAVSAQADFNALRRLTDEIYHMGVTGKTSLIESMPQGTDKDVITEAIARKTGQSLDETAPQEIESEPHESVAILARARKKKV